MAEPVGVVRTDHCATLRQGMSGPYRSEFHTEQAEPPRDLGLVGDIIKQFADPFAFYRELVQNAIDAGSPEVAIDIGYDDTHGVVVATVADRGEGMTREIIEHRLLVLFRSTKENDDAKIGKFGVGFVSVLSPNPSLVTVTTARDGRRLIVHLRPDVTYELFDGGPASHSGTTIDLAIAMASDQVAGFIAASRAALERWCRHAQVPIHFTAPNSTGDRETTRIDRPLDFPAALVQVIARSDDGALTVVAALVPGIIAYVGFFNHGLMLAETPEPLLGDVAVKIQDSRLGHTLSRDGVRRDGAYDRALGFAREQVADALPAAVATAIQDAAFAGDLARWWALADAVSASDCELGDRWWFPLVDPVGGARAVARRSLPKRVWWAQSSTPLSRVAAAAGRFVILCDDQHQPSLRHWLRELANCELCSLASNLNLVTPVTPTADEAELVSRLADHLAATHRAVLVELATIDGAHSEAPWIARKLGAPTGEPFVVDHEDAATKPLGRTGGRLVLSHRHSWVRSAVARGPVIGSELLARLVLLHHGLLDSSRSHELLDRVLDQLAIR